MLVTSIPDVVEPLASSGPPPDTGIDNVRLKSCRVGDRTETSRASAHRELEAAVAVSTGELSSVREERGINFKNLRSQSWYEK